MRPFSLQFLFPIVFAASMAQRSPYLETLSDGGFQALRTHSVVSYFFFPGMKCGMKRLVVGHLVVSILSYTEIDFVQYEPHQTNFLMFPILLS